MSIKSLLQLILLLLIFLIIGGIYFFYFYTGNNIQVFDTNNISKNEQKIINQDNETVEEVLEDIKIDNSKVLDDNKEEINNKNKVLISKKIHLIKLFKQLITMKLLKTSQKKSSMLLQTAKEIYLR